MSEYGTCPECGGDLIKRNGKYGEFIGCSNFPECKFIKKEKKEAEFNPELGLCPECGSPLVKKEGKKGEFIACSAFPECRFTKSINNDENSKNESLKNENSKTENSKKSNQIIFIDEDYGNCPNCGSPLIKRDGKKGPFLSCAAFPNCNFAIEYTEGVNPDFTNVERCPKCGSALVKKEGKFGAFMSCSNFPKCKFSMSIEK